MNNTIDISLTPYYFYKLPFEEQLKCVNRSLLYDHSFCSLPMEQRRRLTTVVDPQWKQLEDKLLSLGGEAVVVQPCDYTKKLLSSGQRFPGRSTFDKMEPGNCHGNVGLLWVELQPEFEICTGWALTKDDGLWRQHSWGRYRARQTVETTMKRSLYFGTVLNRAEAIIFAIRTVPGYAEDFNNYLLGAVLEGFELEPHELEAVKLLKEVLEISSRNNL